MVGQNVLLLFPYRRTPLYPYPLRKHASMEPMVVSLFRPIVSGTYWTDNGVPW